MNLQTAFLIVDAQVNMFKGESAVYEHSKILAKLKSLIQQARIKKVPVIFIQHNGPAGDVDETGTEGWKIQPELAPRGDEFVSQKFQLDAFEGTELHRYLQNQKINELIIAGMQSDHCIQTNCRKAKQLGYKVTLIEDGHSTCDSKTLKAAQIIQNVNNDLKPIVHLAMADQINF